MAAKRQPIGYTVRRPLTLWGKNREIGEFLPPEEVASLARLESMVRAGRLNPVYADVDNITVEKGRTGKVVTITDVDGNTVTRGSLGEPKPARKGRPKKVEEPVVEPEPVVEEPVVEPEEGDDA
jgi:hypothetical protein